MNYQGKLKEFFDYLRLPGGLEQQGQAFLAKVRSEEEEEEVSGRNVIDSMCKRCLSQVCNMMMISNEGQTQISAANRMDELFS